MNRPLVRRRNYAVVGNETWRVTAAMNRRVRRNIAKELDGVHAAIKKGDMALADLLLGEFGDLLLDTDIRFAEVM